MSSDDDRLAPVTDLFGGRRAGGRSPAQGDAAARGPETSDGSGTASSGAASDGEWASDDLPGDDEATPTPGVAKPQSSAPVAVLPTYAAFAARSEGGETAAPVRESFHAAIDADDETEPEESFEAAQKRAENISLHALTRRGVSSREMASTLRSRDLPEEVVLAEVERLERVGLLDDAELAENLVRGKLERKGLGKSGVTAELRQRGLAQEAIDAAVEGIDDDEEQGRADEWARKRAGQLRGLDHATAERRLSGYLMRRGYRSEVVRRAIEKALPRGGSPRGSGVRFE
ncbi:Regulatory protein RecX [Frondihabitans sp. 762G35]|uniref:regulatory protein RecX n=1 Tax=Frondihabitans sp. 762G35 TaxID=1446794 RepID=UPI000D210C6A|nr:regulatory protein RecX [Frondihabitans sp. 762G35]ARC56565.1 Regulatory protein RecX [Frondihabitans sp. 762G35]